MAIDRSNNAINRKVRNNYNPNSYEKGLKVPAGLYRGVVVNNQDPMGMGRIRVHVAALYGSVEPGLNAGTNIDSQDTYLGAHWCRCLLPTTSGTTQLAGGGQAAFGMTGPRPHVDNEVLVAFSGDSTSGVVVGVFPDINRIGNTAAGPRVGVSADGSVSPAVTEVGRDATSIGSKPPEHPLADNLREQGLDKDRIRGVNRSSVGGGAAIGGSGTTGGSSPLGITTPAGHHLVMEDGIGDGETADGQGIRLRSAAGSQILMDDTNGLVYIVNRNGSSWIEMNRNGDIDIFCGNSLNIGTPGEINFTAGGNINMQAGRAINMQANGGNGVKIAAPAGSIDIFAQANMQLQADSNGNIKIGGNLRATAGRIDLNGPTANSATLPTVNELAGNTGISQSIASRVPEAEPWAGHLDVSNLGATSAEGGASVQESTSYYYGAPTAPAAYDGQTSDFDIDQFTPVDLPAGSLVQWAPGVDRNVDAKLINVVLEIAQRFGRPLTITSGYRSPARNQRAGGARRSQHMLGKAVDISGSGLNNQDRLNLVGLASSLGIIGIGVYSGGSLHFDIRDGDRAGWGSDYTYNSVPSYAVEAINRHIAGKYQSPAPLSNPAPTVDPNGEESPDSNPNPGLTPERQTEIESLASKYGAAPEAIAGVLNIESGIDPNARGGAGNQFYGIFQLDESQIPDLTQAALGTALDVSQYRNLSFNDQLSVLESYWNRWGVTSSSGFFTGDPAADASRLWALQLAPANATSIDYNDPNAVITSSKQSDAISTQTGIVTVGSVQSSTVEKGKLS